MENGRNYIRKEEVLVETANFQYGGNLEEMRADIAQHMRENYERIGAERREMFVRDIKILERLILN